MAEGQAQRRRGASRLPSSRGDRKNDNGPTSAPSAIQAVDIYCLCLSQNKAAKPIVSDLWEG
jgi:hypothetical protein